jgi:hypothetical protein
MLRGAIEGNPKIVKVLPLRSAQEPPLWRVRLADFQGRGIYGGYPNKYHCIFIHVPHVAGTSVARSLFGVPSRHNTYAEYMRANTGKFCDYFKFAFVRNPWDRLVSTVYFLRNGGVKAGDRAWTERNLGIYRNFEHFVRVGLQRPEIQSWVHFRPQSEFVLSPENRKMVDFIGRFENLTQDFEEVARRLGLPGPLATINASSHAAFETYYTPETAEIVGQIYARDVKCFGYEQPVWRSERAQA